MASELTFENKLQDAQAEKLTSLKAQKLKN